MNCLKDLRKTRNVTQVKVANYLGIPRGAYTNIENGRRQLDPTSICKLADYFGVTTDYLLGRSDVAEPAKNQPIADGDELDRELIDLMRDLSPEDFQRVKDFVAGLKAARGASSSRRS